VTERSNGLKKDTDAPLRGKADYVCQAGHKVAWVVEAKPQPAYPARRTATQ